VKCLLLLFFLASPAAADTPWLDPQNYGTTAVEVKKGTVAVEQAGPFTVSLSTDPVSEVGSSFVSVSASISVTAGAGSSIFSSTGTIVTCGIVPPVGASYMFEVVTNDADEYPVYGHNRIVSGRVGMSGHGETVMGSSKIKISAASVDGSWKVRCIIRR